MSAEWIAVVIAVVSVGVSGTLAVVSGFRRLDDRLRDVEARLDARLRDVEARLDARLRDVEARLDARLRDVETGLAFLRGRLQEDEPEIEPEPPAVEPAAASAGQPARN